MWGLPAATGGGAGPAAIAAELTPGGWQPPAANEAGGAPVPGH